MSEEPNHTPSNPSSENSPEPKTTGKRGLFNRPPKNSPPSKSAPKQSSDDEKAILDRMYSYLDSDNRESSGKKNTNWLDSFWENGVSEENKRDLGYSPSKSDNSDEQPIGGVIDKGLYDEWMGITRKEKQAQAADMEIYTGPLQLPEPDEKRMLPSGLEYAAFEEIQQHPIEPIQHSESTAVSPAKDDFQEMRSFMQEDPTDVSGFFSEDDSSLAPNSGKRQPIRLSRLEIFLVSFLIILIAAVSGVIVRTVSAPKTQPEAAPSVQSVTDTPAIPDNLPDPVGVEITGGWFFPLNPSTMVDGKWKPTKAEWLVGTEVSRVVALPWTKQLEAIIRSLNPGDSIRLRFENQTQIIYSVQKTEQIPLDRTDVMNQSAPSLIIILYGQDSPDRWVVTCLP